MDTHHALLLIGTDIASASVPPAYTTHSNDVTHVISDSLGIDEARALTASAQLKPIESDKRIFVVIARTITSEAQNALLKLFEEPPLSAKFFLVVPSEHILLPTLRSRLQKFEERDAVTDADKNEVFTSFLSASYAERMALIAEKTKAKDTEWTSQLFSGIEAWTAERPIERADTLASLVFTGQYFGARGASTKMLLEELALSLSEK